MQRTAAPSPGVILAYFNIYLQYEKKINEKKSSEKDHKEGEKEESGSPSFISFLTSSFEGVKQTVQATVDHLTGADVKLEKLYKYLRDKLKPENPEDKKTPPPEKWSWAEWVDFIIELRHKGAEAQGAKTASGQSRCCEIFFAIADYVQSVVLQSEEGQKAYAQKVYELRNQIKSLKRQINVDSNVDGKSKGKGENVKRLNKELDKVILDLAYLGDPKGILKASTRVNTETRMGLLDHLLSVSKKEEHENVVSHCRKSPFFNDARPYVLQWSFANICFTDRKFYVYTKVGYPEFVLKAEQEYSNKQLQLKEEEEKKHTVKETMSEINLDELAINDFNVISPYIVPEYPKKDAMEENVEKGEDQIESTDGETLELEADTSVTLNGSQASVPESQPKSTNTVPPPATNQQTLPPTKPKEVKKSLSFWNKDNKEKKETSPPAKETGRSPKLGNREETT